ncbi:MAG: FecR domain-containing protein [Planctomycetota bacterium]|nr:FecR domain-containing protein [Planctomycetota bacterium]
MPEISDSFYDLAHRYLDGELDPAELGEFNELLRARPELREAFAALCVRSRMVREIGEPQRQAEIHTTDSPTGVVSQLKLARDTAQSQGRRGIVPWGRVLAAVAALALVSVVLFWGFRQPGNTPRFTAEPVDVDSPGSKQGPGQVAKKHYIARLVQVVKAKWGEENPGLKKGSRLSAGKIRIESGLAKLRFSSGAKVTLEGPAEYEIISNDLTRLVSGRLSAKIPKSAIGFKVDTPTARVLDLGTAFGVDVDDNGATEVAVFEGEVEVELPGPAESSKGKRLITHGNSVRTEAGAKEINDAFYDVSKFRKTWPVTAGMVSTAGMVKFAPPGPLSTLLEHEDDDHLVILPERGSFTVSKKLKVRANITAPGEYSKRGSLETGRIEPGRVLASYLVQFNPVEEGKKKREQKNRRLVGIATFERPIAGVITATGLLRATDKTLGGHSEPLVVKGRGLEIGTRRPVDTVILSDDRKTLVLDLHVSGGQIDQIRVLVEGEE